MGENSAIAWTNHTFNPWMGCTKISPACDHCYAENLLVKRFHWDHLWSGRRQRTAPATWRNPIKWNRQANADGVRKRVFCASLADVFDNQAEPEWRDDLWNVVRATPHLDWLMLTKRPQNIGKMLPPDWGNGFSNVWLGTTVENQTEARRIDHLRDIPAAVRFLSCEPLLEAIEPDLNGISWVICGGESGQVVRFMDPEWARRLRDQCAERDVAFFMKQMSGKTKADLDRIPADLFVRQYPAPDPCAAASLAA